MRSCPGEESSAIIAHFRECIHESPFEKLMQHPPIFRRFRDPPEAVSRHRVFVSRRTFRACVVGRLRLGHKVFLEHTASRWP